MIKKTLIFLPLACLFLSLVNSPVVLSPWNEEKTDSLGPAITAHSLGEVHSTIHYDLTRFLAIKMGISPDTAEIIARFCALVDQINPKPGYPYHGSLNSISIPDTFPDWPQSLAGTERGGLVRNDQHEYTAQYWHFPFRDFTDTLTGKMVWKAYPELTDTTNFTGPPHFWRVPLTSNLNSIRNWALYHGGQPGLPDELTPVQVKYADANSLGYQLVQPNSIQAFAIFLHSLADSYSHEECMATDTLRGHPSDDPYCGLTYHSEHEFAYDANMRAKKHADSCFHAIWRALREYKRVHNIKTPVLWTTDNNGFQDGDGIPDQLEDDGDADSTESFLERWKNPAAKDLNGDGKINHSDHTTWRIHMCNVGFQPNIQVGISKDGSDPDPSAVLEVKSTDQGLLIPRVSTTSRDLIPSPASGLLIYNITTNQFNYFNGSFWYSVETTFISASVGTLHPGGGVSISAAPGALPESSAMLDVSNSSRGILLPRTTPDLILTPATGLIIYNTATNLLNFYNGVSWVSLCAVSTGIAGAGGNQSALGMAISPEGADPHFSAMLDVSAIDKGVLIPRVSTAQRDAILPVSGLVIFNTSSHNLEFYNGLSWYQLNTNLPVTPTGGTHVPAQTQIVWNWNSVPAVSGYKWNSVNDYNSAADMASATTKTETNLTCNIAYTRYVWAYNSCGHSLPVSLSQTTSLCPPCGTSFTINHVTGTFAPVNKTVTYGTVTGVPGEPFKCWITSNLGADRQALTRSDGSEASAGWYWQFNRKQGYKHNGILRTPNSSWITTISENSDWTSENDPCTHELGGGWRVPSFSEWTNVDGVGLWSDWTGPWSSALKMHAAGYLSGSDGSLLGRGSEGAYWSSSGDGIDDGWSLYFKSDYCDTYNDNREVG
ncbi:MAG: hypothetical protein WCK09_14410, partial [Bacteroidota bacterium]